LPGNKNAIVVVIPVQIVSQPAGLNIDGNVRLRMTTLGQDIVLRGAAVLVLSGQLGVS